MKIGKFYLINSLQFTLDDFERLFYELVFTPLIMKNVGIIHPAYLCVGISPWFEESDFTIDIVADLEDEVNLIPKYKIWSYRGHYKAERVIPDNECQNDQNCNWHSVYKEDNITGRRCIKCQKQEWF